MSFPKCSARFTFVRVMPCVLVLMTVFGDASAAYRITLQPTLTVTEEYTDNLYLSEDAADYDRITVVSPGFELRGETRNSHVALSYHLGYSDYARFSENNAWRHNSLMTSEISLSSRTRLSFDNSLIVTEDPVEQEEDSEEAERTTEKETVRKERDRYLNNTAALGLTHQFNKSDSVSLQYVFDILNNEDPGVRNTKKHIPSLTLTCWPIPNRLETKTRVAYQRDDTDDATDDPGYSEERIDPSIDLTYWVIPRKFSLKAGLAYTRGVSYENADDAAGENTDKEDDNWYESIIPSVGMTYRFSPKWGFEADTSCTRAITWDQDDLSDPDDDFETWTGRLKLSHTFSKSLEGFVQYDQSQTDFEGEGGTESDDSDYTVCNPSVGLTMLLAENLPLTFGLGYVLRDIKDEGTEAAITVNGAVNRWQFSRYGFLSFKASSGYDESNLGAESLGFGFYYDMNLRISYIFSNHLSADVYGLYKRDKFTDNEDDDSQDEDSRDDTTTEVGAGITWQPLRWVYMRLGYSYREVNSTSDEDSYDVNRVTFDVSFTPQRPFRIW
ncbi:hypothetical protein DENIS_0174 [Desulfonema ishimotonii]|uniref:TIGR03016 family PEP-CTERM system-associated outer membrane protein n=1 Tax=Desulfonema ishimotonii TaxID=45657 RepID=A0A401FQH1_9BACT|nr:outer membrane beta-barrel protein [Desulfonema ishimotonii]GBC59238.1 hypothetical protein DENIS_0174 [Desulfonema ishimotonii]